jgi:shikimate dehydrogenase
MKLYAVAGRPIMHSRSPDIFGHWFNMAKMPALYTRVSGASAAAILRLAEEIGLAGLNVTAPFKEEMALLLGEKDSRATLLSAVNTVLFSRPGAVGYNTDVDGVRYTLAVANFQPQGKKAVVLGAGGAARAAAFALQEHGAAVTMVNRTVERAKRAAALLNCAWAEIGDLPQLLRRADALISCLPLLPSWLDERWLQPGLFVLDADYRAAAVGRAAARCGCTVADGRQWLAGQAAAAYFLFTGRKCAPGWPAQALRRIGRKARTKSNIALIGMMGAGKSTVGRELAETLGWSFRDSDRLVAERAGCPVPLIFKRQGENYFRELEKEVVAEIAGGDRQVIALGGGALLNDTSRRRICRTSRTIWLWADVATLALRTAGSQRPLLVGSASNNLKGLLDRRLDAYAQAADLILDSQGAATEIVRWLADEIH